MDIFHINLASQAEKSYSTRARWGLRAIRKYVLLGLKPSGHIVYRPRTRRGYTIPPARLRWYEYISATLRYLEYNWLNRMNYCVWLQFRFHSVLLFDSSYKGPSIKDVRTRGGGGVSQKRTHADAGGWGGQWQNADVRKIQIFTKNSKFILCTVC